jgi:hypothetical protein
MSDYNGWSNRATWNLALWLTEDFGQCFLDDLIEDAKRIKCGEDIREWMCASIIDLDMREWFLEAPKGCEPSQFFTPDGERFGDVNWDEIFQHFIADERKEVSK